MLRRLLISGALAASLTAALTLSPVAGASAPPTAKQRETLQRYAAATWRSFVAMTNEQTGLTADNINADTRARAAYTSPTNIAAYIWSTIAARELGIISASEARNRVDQTLDTLATMERSHGFYYNWYDPATGKKLTIWPVNGDKIDPFLSSVDNGWLAAALMMVRTAMPALAASAEALLEPMNFGFFYNPAEGQLRGGYWPEGTTQCNVNGFTCHHYGTLNTEPRIASYIGIAAGDIPPEHYFRMFRTFQPTCDWSWQEMQPAGVTRTYLGVSVYEGHYTYRGMNIVPSWGGSMFEALMVPLLVPEASWGPSSWGVNHPLYVRAQIEHGLEDADYGYWGFSPSNDPSGGYREYGVDPIGLNPDGYFSDEEKTPVDYGFDSCPGRETQSIPTDYGNGVVTPHASFLALQYAPQEALRNLRQLRQDFDAYAWGGFLDAINVGTGQVSRYYLALDQGMVMFALANELTGYRFQHYFSDQIEAQIRPLLAIEEFTAGTAAP